MNDPYEPYQDDLDELLRQVDELFGAPEETLEPPEADFDPDDYAPQDASEDEPMVFHNYSNRYGADIRNFSNGYGSGRSPEPANRSSQSVIPAYNADFRRPEKDTTPRSPRQPRQERVSPGGTSAPARSGGGEKKKKRARRPGCCGCGCGTMLIGLGALILAMVLALSWVFAVPKSDQTLGRRKRDTASILVCGTDADGTRTDTMMLLYLSGSEKQVSLVSLPRDTYTITSSGSGAKLNSAYGRNGCGQEGMEGLLDYVQEIIGYRPDGYILVDMTIVPQIVDLMGGVEVDVPQEMYLEGMTLSPGVQRLDGAQVLTLLRYRSGYANADLGRIEVQRTVLKACMEQWLDSGHIRQALQAVELVENASVSSLNLRNYLWMGKTMLLGLKGFSSHTLPGYADYIGDVSYYLLDREDVAALVNESCNPYREEILPENLKIAG